MHSEGAFLGVEAHSIFPYFAEYGFYMGCVLLILVIFDNHVVHTYFKHFSHLIIEYFFHHSLVSCPNIYKVEGNDPLIEFLSIIHK